jgi:hypothetical protein
MVSRLPTKHFLINWLKALVLSPGVLFPAGYFCVYLSTNIYLNTEFKKSLAQSVSEASGNTLEISIESLKPGLILDSVTLNSIKLTPTGEHGSYRQMNSQPVTISTIEIASPDLEKVLFSPAERLSSTLAISEKILSDNRIDH